MFLATGALIQNPKFSLFFYPPVDWTYFDGTTTPASVTSPTTFAGQQPNQLSAERKMNFDIQSAVCFLRDTIVDLDYSQSVRHGRQRLPVHSEWLHPGEHHRRCERCRCECLNPFKKEFQAKIGTYVPELGAVTVKRTADTSNAGTLNFQVSPELSRVAHSK